MHTPVFPVSKPLNTPGNVNGREKGGRRRISRRRVLQKRKEGNCAANILRVDRGRAKSSETISKTPRHPRSRLKWGATREKNAEKYIMKSHTGLEGTRKPIKIFLSLSHSNQSWRLNVSRPTNEMAFLVPFYFYSCSYDFWAKWKPDRTEHSSTIKRRRHTGCQIAKDLAVKH